MSDAVRKLVDALRTIGPTAEAIAKVLRRANVRGTPMDMCGCPLAVYLTGKCGAPVRVGRTVAVVELHSIVTPQPVRAFIDRFESVEWPDLCLAYGGGA